jgi:hypothetical protein
MNKELSIEERWEWLKTTCWGKCIIPWDRMALPTHEWMDRVQTLDRIDDKTFATTRGDILIVPRYWDELTEEMSVWLKKIDEYKTNQR